MLDAACRTCTGSAVRSAYQYHISFGLCDAGGNRAHTGLRDEFHTDPGMGIDILEVKDQLREVLNRVDVMMRRRRYQCDSRYGVACPCYEFIHLEARQLSAFSRFCALGHLDLDFICIDKIICIHSETS